MNIYEEYLDVLNENKIDLSNMAYSITEILSYSQGMLLFLDHTENVSNSDEKFEKNLSHIKTILINIVDKSKALLLIISAKGILSLDDNNFLSKYSELKNLGQTYEVFRFNFIENNKGEKDEKRE